MRPDALNTHSVLSTMRVAALLLFIAPPELIGPSSNVCTSLPLLRVERAYDEAGREQIEESPWLRGVDDPAHGCSLSGVPGGGV